MIQNPLTCHSSGVTCEGILNLSEAEFIIRLRANYQTGRIMVRLCAPPTKNKKQYFHNCFAAHFFVAAGFIFSNLRNTIIAFQAGQAPNFITIP